MRLNKNLIPRHEDMGNVEAWGDFYRVLSKREAKEKQTRTRGRAARKAARAQKRAV